MRQIDPSPMPPNDVARLVALQTSIETEGLEEAERLLAGFAADRKVVAGGAVYGHAALCLGRAWLRCGDTERAMAHLGRAKAGLGRGGERSSSAWIDQLLIERGFPEVSGDGTDGSFKGGEAAFTAALVRLVRAVATPPDAPHGVADHVEHRLVTAFSGHPLLPTARRALAAWRGAPVEGEEILPFRDGGTEDDGLAWRLCADLWHRAGYPLAAAACLQRAVELVPWRLDWQFALATACIRSNALGRLAPFWRALPIPFPGVPRWRLIRCAARWWEGIDVPGALTDCRAAQVIDPAFWPAYLAHLSILGGWGGVEAASAAFTRFLRHGRRGSADLLPTDCDALPAIGRRAVRLAPQSAVFNDYGAALFQVFRLADAERAFCRALALDPFQRHAAINLAVVLLCRGKTERLRRYLRLARFAADLPKSLALEQWPADREASSPQQWPDIWRLPIDSAEWQRRAVFSQHWWRALAEE